jgi:hypothetical protein
MFRTPVAYPGDRYRLSVEGIEVSAVFVVLTSWFFVSTVGTAMSIIWFVI